MIKIKFKFACIQPPDIYGENPTSGEITVIKNTTQTGGIVQTGWVPGVGSIDMNGDQKQDIFFRSETGPFYKYALVRGSLQDGIQFDFCKTPLLPNTRIDDSLNWETSTNSTIMIPIRHGFPEAGSLGYPVYADENTLAGRYPDDTEGYNFWNNGERGYIERNNWGAAAYLGIRMINKADTLYGRIKLQVTDFYKINLHSYGIQNRSGALPSGRAGKGIPVRAVPDRFRHRAL